MTETRYPVDEARLLNLLRLQADENGHPAIHVADAAAKVGISGMRARRILRTWEDRDWWDWGVTVWRGWFTTKAPARLPIQGELEIPGTTSLEKARAAVEAARPALYSAMMTIDIEFAGMTIVIPVRMAFDRAVKFTPEQVGYVRRALEQVDRPVLTPRFDAEAERVITGLIQDGACGG